MQYFQCHERLKQGKRFGAVEPSIRTIQVMESSPSPGVSPCLQDSRLWNFFPVLTAVLANLGGLARTSFLLTIHIFPTSWCEAGHSQLFPFSNSSLTALQRCIWMFMSNFACRLGWWCFQAKKRHNCSLRTALINQSLSPTILKDHYIQGILLLAAKVNLKMA